MSIFFSSCQSRMYFEKPRRWKETEEKNKETERKRNIDLLLEFLETLEEERGFLVINADPGIYLVWLVFGIFWLILVRFRHLRTDLVIFGQIRPFQIRFVPTWSFLVALSFLALLVVFASDGSGLYWYFSVNPFQNFLMAPSFCLQVWSNLVEFSQIRLLLVSFTFVRFWLRLI